MSDDMEDVLVTDLRRGMAVDLLSTAEAFGEPTHPHEFEFATVEAATVSTWRVPGDSVLVHTDQGNWLLPTHWTVQWASHLDIEDWQAER